MKGTYKVQTAKLTSSIKEQIPTTETCRLVMTAITISPKFYSNFIPYKNQ